MQSIDVTEIRSPNIGSDLLPKRRIKNLSKINNTKIGNSIKSTETNSPTGYSGATSLAPTGNSFMYIEMTHNNHGHNRIFVSWERTDIIQNSNITLYYNRFSNLTDNSKKSAGRFRIQIILKDNSWNTQDTTAKNDRYSDTSTDWTLLNLDFTQENYGIKYYMIR